MPTISTDDLFNTFAALTDSDLIALRKSASYHLRGTQFSDPYDLIHEAFVRCLDERRRWDGVVPFTLYLSNIMKSISSAERNSFDTRKIINLSQFSSHDIPDFLGWLSPRVPSAEDVNIQLEEAAFARAHLISLKNDFEGDDVALAVIEAWGTGEQSPEIMARHGITFKNFEAARKRVERRVTKISKTNGGKL